ncbi:MAG: hypothetical protein JNM19_10420 [Chitinophagaceae bacterium]|nr:hypothetical protein [Chitinophagaceae bacterium]
MISLIIVLGVLVLLLCWILVSPFVIKVDSRLPAAELRWISIGHVRIWYDNEWWLSLRILFYSRTLRFAALKRRNDEKRKKAVLKNKKPKRRMGLTRIITKMVRVIKTFRVTEWKLAIDTGDHTLNARLYPLNFFPHLFKHLAINFRNENYLVLTIRNRPWKMLYAFLR